MSGRQIYYLMHKNDVVTMIEIDEVSGSIIDVAHQIKKELLPPGGNLNKADLKSWWKRRAVPAEQAHIKELLLQKGLSTTQAYLTQNLGLSLSDHYWIKPVQSELAWEDVNLFSNNFKDEINELDFSDLRNKDKKIDLREQTTFYPSASVQGELQKKWIIQNGTRYLIKGNYGATCQQSINEVIASEMHALQNRMPYTTYRLCDINAYGKCGLGCICEDFASHQIEFISAYDVVCSVKKRNEVSEYEHFIEVCGLNGLDRNSVRMFLEYQILTDFVITNTDRHFNNFGVLRDSESLQYVGMAPIFDSGNSMFWDDARRIGNDDLLDIRVSSFRKKEVDLLTYVTDVHLVDISALPKEESVKELLEKDAALSDKIDWILKGYQRKLQLLEKVQAGEKIWKYGYKG